MAMAKDPPPRVLSPPPPPPPALCRPPPRRSPLPQPQPLRHQTRPLPPTRKRLSRLSRRPLLPLTAMPPALRPRAMRPLLRRLTSRRPVPTVPTAWMPAPILSNQFGPCGTLRTVPCPSRLCEDIRTDLIASHRIPLCPHCCGPCTGMSLRSAQKRVRRRLLRSAKRFWTWKQSKSFGVCGITSSNPLNSQHAKALRTKPIISSSNAYAHSIVPLHSAPLFPHLILRSAACLLAVPRPCACVAIVQGVIPAWEEPSCAKGGQWLLELGKDPNDIDDQWEFTVCCQPRQSYTAHDRGTDLRALSPVCVMCPPRSQVLGMIGDQFEDSADVLGAAIRLRPKGTAVHSLILSWSGLTVSPSALSALLHPSACRRSSGAVGEGRRSGRRHPPNRAKSEGDR
jgi:hypothetical protein